MIIMIRHTHTYTSILILSSLIEKKIDIEGHWLNGFMDDSISTILLSVKSNEFIILM